MINRLKKELRVNTISIAVNVIVLLIDATSLVFSLVMRNSGSTAFYTLLTVAMVICLAFNMKVRKRIMEDMERWRGRWVM